MPVRFLTRLIPGIMLCSMAATGDLVPCVYVETGKLYR